MFFLYIYASGAMEDNGRAGQGRVHAERPGGRATIPQHADQHGEGGTGESKGEADKHLHQCISASYQVQDVWVSDTVWYTYWMCIIQYLFLSEVAGFCRSTIWNLHDGVTCLAFMTLNLIVHSQLLPILVFYYGFFSKCIHNRSRDIFRVLEK